MIKAVFFDVDGTLMSHKSRSVPESARRAVEALRRKGILCIVATGRQTEQLKKLPIADVEFDGYITVNGQLVTDREGNILFDVPLTGRVKEYLVRGFEEKTFPALMVEKERTYLNFVDERVRVLQEAISTPIPNLGEYNGADLYQVCVYLNPEDEYLMDEIAGECVMSRWAFGGMDVIAKGGGKVTGIRRYLEKLGISPEETIAFGDAENDIEMLRFAGIGVAMGNAWECVKEAADYVTADIDEDGIAKALQHFGLIE